jgi:predicted metal-dependent hydrolase
VLSHYRRYDRRSEARLKSHAATRIGSAVVMSSDRRTRILPADDLVRYGSTVITYRVERMKRRRAAIEVNPDLTVIVKVPALASVSAIRSAVREKARWILRQQRFFSDLLPKTPKRRLVGGESHLYLGRKYRLRVHECHGEEAVTLSGGYLHLKIAASAARSKRVAVLQRWYLLQARRVFGERFQACLQHPAFRRIDDVHLIIRRMTRRWGSCTSRRNLVLNTELVRAPRGCIDYVITHELCHLIIPDHSRKFTNMLDRVMPDWRDRKRQLERRLA